MKWKDLTILALILLAGYLFFVDRGSDPNRKIMQKAQADSLKYAKKLDSLSGNLKRSQATLQDSIQSYQKKIQLVLALQKPEIDTFFVVRYKHPISEIEVQRSVIQDLITKDQREMELRSCKNVTSIQADIIENQLGIIRTDSIRIREIPNMEREIKRLKRSIRWTRIGAVGSAVLLILVLA